MGSHILKKSTGPEASLVRQNGSVGNDEENRFTGDGRGKSNAGLPEESGKSQRPWSENLP